MRQSVLNPKHILNRNLLKRLRSRHTHEGMHSQRESSGWLRHPLRESGALGPATRRPRIIEGKRVVGGKEEGTDREARSLGLGLSSYSTRNALKCLHDKWLAWEGPTWAIALSVYTGWLLTTWFHACLPWWLLLPCGAWLLAWHGSLQHETIHGHPAGPGWLAPLLGFPPLSLWLPYPIYNELHRQHHQSRGLTEPIHDPESFYMSPTRWAQVAPWQRAFLRAHQTLCGRLLLGPPVSTYLFLKSEWQLLRKGNRQHTPAWLIHVLAVALVLAWVVGICHMPLWRYLLFFVYPGTSLTLLRSFAEHRAHPVYAERTAVVEAGPLLSLLFLNNNLHYAHHKNPGLAWYKLPSFYRNNRSHFLQENGHLVFQKGYAEITHRHLFRPFSTPFHPFIE